MQEFLIGSSRCVLSGELEPPLSGPPCDQQKCPLRSAVCIRNVMWSLRLMGFF